MVIVELESSYSLQTVICINNNVHVVPSAILGLLLMVLQGKAPVGARCQVRTYGLVLALLACALLQTA